MTAVALELDQMLARLKPEAAEKLEMRVREVLSAVSEAERALPTLEEMKRRMPEYADLIGCWRTCCFMTGPWSLEIPRSFDGCMA